MRVLTIAIALLVLNSSNVDGQSKSEPFYFSLTYASEPYDDRIFGFRDEHINTIREINKENPPKPTRYLKAEVGYDFFSDSKFLLGVGLGIAQEKNSYHRYYNHCVIKSPCTKDFKYLDSYQYYLLGIKVAPKYQLYSRKGWKALMGIDMMPSARFNSIYNDSATEARSWSKLDFFSMEVNPNLGFSYRQFEFGFFYRLWQIRKVDRVIHTSFSGSGHPVLLADYEKRNPTKIGLSVKYRFNIKRKGEE